MKKIYALLITIVLSLSLCSCKYSDYKKAVSAMQQSNYPAAYEILCSIPEYKDSAELISECTYQMASDALSQNDYETAYRLFSSISDYNDSLQKSNECSILLGYQAANAMKENIIQAVANGDDELLCQLVSSYLTMEHAHDEITAKMNDFVIETIGSQLEAANYDNYLFLDRLITLVDNNALLKPSIGDQLSALNFAHHEQRTIAFLTGTWQRIDSSDSSGLRISITCSEENSFAMILEDLSFVSAKNHNAKFHWDKGLLIWNQIQIVDSNYITMDSMWLTSYYWLGVQSNQYKDCIGYLDYDGMRIITQSTGEDDITWHDNFNSIIYVKESAIKNVPTLSESDFIVSFNETNSTFEADTANLCEWFSPKNTLFCAYNGVNLLTTARGISVGSGWKDVVDKYGYGRGNLYVEADDAIYGRLKKSNLKDDACGELLCDILTNQADEYMEYSLDDTAQTLRFYFDNGIVSWICLYTS